MSSGKFNIWLVFCLAAGAFVYSFEGFASGAATFIFLSFLPFVWEEASKPGDP